MKIWPALEWWAEPSGKEDWGLHDPCLVSFWPWTRDLLMSVKADMWDINFYSWTPSSWGYLKAHYVHKSQSTLHSQDGHSEVLLPFLNLPLRLCDLQPGCWWPWAKSLNILSPSTEWWEQRELPGPMVHCEDELFPDAHKTLWVPLRGAWLLWSPGEFPSFVTKVELCFITLATHYILVTSQELAWSHM